jgi:hypothetical protein
MRAAPVAVATHQALHERMLLQRILARAGRRTGQDEHHSAFRRIQLDLAPGPSGSMTVRPRYVFVAPLDDDGRIDHRLWKDNAAECRVVRFYGASEHVGHLVGKANGAWAFRYDRDGEREDETGFHFAVERFVPGRHVSIKHANKRRIYRVSSVERVSIPSIPAME